MVPNRKIQIGTLLASSIVCVAISFWAARAIQIRSGWNNLATYIAKLDKTSGQVEEESSRAISAVAHDNLAFCSDDELAFMRSYLFRSRSIRDLGRTRDGMLYCTTGLGRLATPYPTESPDLVTYGMMIRRRIPLLFAEPAMGTVIERDGVSIVLNPDLTKSLEEPPMHYSVLYFDENQLRMLSVADPPGALTNDEVISGKKIDRDGTIYRTVCTKSLSRCVVVFEQKRDVLAAGRRMIIWSVIGGIVFGIVSGLLLLRYLRLRHSMESQLRRALRRGTITMAYQPIVSLATGKIIAAEALARWTDEDGKSISPDVFVALAAERGFTRDITHLVVGFVAEEISDMLAEATFSVSINIAPSDLTEEPFFRHLKKCLADAKVDPSRIILELTEHSLAHHDGAVAAIARLRHAGHRVYIDDFGTGYSNFVSLHKLDVDGLKVDRAFTQMIGRDATSASVVPQILDMARQLNLAVVVEGIETEEQAEYFRRSGAGIFGQGWLFGKPVPAAQLRALLAKDGR